MALALVTGASSGIGQSLARVIAADGHDLVLVARRADRLAALAEELRTTTARVDVLAADLLEEDSLRRVEERLRSRLDPIAELVNNAGVALYGSFADSDLEQSVAQFSLHVLGPLRLMHAALPGMLERGTGGVLNISSLAYSASKAALITLSESVHDEVRRHGVRVSCAAPGYTRTELQDVAGVDASALPASAWLTADAVAAATWRAHRRGRPLHIPGKLNRATALALRLAPRRISRQASGLLVSRIRLTDRP
jgi:short-subunit dehydrogenase